MRYNIFCVIIVLFTSANAFALLKFPKGTFVLEGKILVHKNDVYLAVNHKSNSESKIKLTGLIPKELTSQSGSNASIKIKIVKPFISYWGEAEFVEVNKYLDPFEVPTVYSDEKLTTNAQGLKILTPPSVVPPGADIFECGEYLIAGKFINSKNGNPFLEIYPTTSRRFPIELNGMHPRDSFWLNEDIIRAKLQVIRAGKGNLAKFNLMEKPSVITRTDALREPIVKITSKPCR